MVSSQRVLNEFVIGLIKRFKFVSDRYRNRRKRFGLRFNLIAGICNYEQETYVMQARGKWMKINDKIEKYLPERSVKQGKVMKKRLYQPIGENSLLMMLNCG
jgi:hypothetical protein